jgi:sulfide:quinone oxidoreductase
MSPTALRVLVAGGGVAAVEAVLALRALGRHHVSVELLAPSNDYAERQSSVLSPFTGAAAPHVTLDGLEVRRHRGALAAVDADAHTVTTTDGGTLDYDRLIVATGAHARAGVPGATQFRGPISAGAVEGALRAARDTALFVLPSQASWPLPLYELALLTAADFGNRLDVGVVTPEPRPLDIFGPVASDALARLLHRAGVTFLGDTLAEEVMAGVLTTRDGRLIAADAVIALATLRGPFLAGLPADADGFIATDEHARVRGVPDVFAAGDITTEPVKQGGLATQQADAAAEQIAAEAGAPVTPRPIRRVLRGVVLTGEAPLFLRRDLDSDEAFTRPLRGAPPGVSRTQLWWPSGKVAGRYLTGFLAAGGRSGDVLAERPPRRPLTRH